jgi:nucleotide-binding universal stress UspA family protein
MRSLLVAVDGSPRALGVFRAATDIARAMRAHVFLYRAVVVPPDFAPAGATRHADPLPAYLEREARAALLALTEQVPDVSCEPRIEQATQPWRAILAMAEELDVDLIVVGSHGYHGWDRVLGTTAGKVANLGHRNVLVVHERARPSADEPAH